MRMIRHIAWDVYPDDARSIEDMCRFEHGDCKQARRAAQSMMDRLLRDMGWHRLATTDGRHWFREYRALSIAIFGIDPAGQYMLKNSYLRNSDRKRKSAKMIDHETLTRRATMGGVARTKKKEFSEILLTCKV